MSSSPEDARGASKGDQSLTIDRRKTLLGLMLAIALTAGVFAIIGQVAHFGELEQAVRRARASWLPVCLLGQLMAYLGYILAYRDVAGANGGPRFSFSMTARIVVFGLGAAVLAATVGGLAVDYWALRRTGTRRHVATRRVLAVGTIEWTVLSVYAFSAAAIVLASGERAPTAMAVAWLAVVPACVAGALWFTAPSRVSRFIRAKRTPRPSHAGGRRAVRWRGSKLEAGFDDAIAGVVLVRHVLAHPLRYRGGAIGYPIYWAGDMLTLYAAVRAFGGQPAPVPLILAYATGNVISSLPLPAGGAGGVESAIAFALSGIGVPLSSALLAAFAYRIITVWLPLLPTLALMPTITRLSETLSKVPHTRPDRDERTSFRPAPQARL